MPESLPNITGCSGTTYLRAGGDDAIGALYGVWSSCDTTWGSGGAATLRNLSFSASKSSSVYKAAAHVRPISRGTCFYIKY